jgi:protein farnesyltransferase subunit beta
MAEKIEPGKCFSEKLEQLPSVWSVLFAKRHEVWRDAVPNLLFDPWNEFAGNPTVEEQKLVESQIIDIDFGRAVYLLHHCGGLEETPQAAEENLVCLLRCLYLQSSCPPQLSQVAVAFCKDLLHRDRHLEYIDGVLDSRRELGEEYLGLEASQTWILYWIAHSMNILGRNLKVSELEGIIRFCESCRSEKGGFGGGPGHRPHIAATFAAVSALCIAGAQKPEAFDIIDRRKFLFWALNELKVQLPEGVAFRVSKDGEFDIRATYCVLAIASLLGVLTRDLTNGVYSWISSLQSFEGAFGGEPGNEAHGGYTFCAVASLKILLDAGLLTEDEFEALISPCRHWLQSRQKTLEGGFQGRTNKLVDSCYSFWLAAACKITGAEFNSDSLVRYILRYCQDCRSGGFRDRPSAEPDFYHTCYALSGLSIALRSASSSSELRNHLYDIHPIYNLTMITYCAAREHFES